MSYVNLSDNVNDSFEFEVREGLRYEMRYPITREVEEIQVLSVELQQATDKDDTAAVEAATAKLEGYLYGLITPIGHDMPIKDALSTVNIRVMANFNKMIKQELSI